MRHLSSCATDFSRRRFLRSRSSAPRVVDLHLPSVVADEKTKAQVGKQRRRGAWVRNRYILSNDSKVAFRCNSHRHYTRSVSFAQPQTVRFLTARSDWQSLAKGVKLHGHPFHSRVDEEWLQRSDLPLSVSRFAG